MAIPLWLQELRSTRNRRQTARSRRSKSPRARLRVELLEERTVPSTLIVTNTFDDGSSGSLRSAVLQANADAAGGTSDTINFDPSLAGATIVLTQGEFALSGAGGGTITIDGSALGTPITISGNNASRVFDISAAGAVVQISGLAITGGNGSSTFSTTPGTQGGDIFNAGFLTLTGDVISGGQATGLVGGNDASGNGLAGGSAQGGGIFNAGTGVLVIDGTTVTGNTASGGAGGNATGNGSSGGKGGMAQGGGVFNDIGGQLTFQNNSQVNGNTAAGAPGGIGNGGYPGESDGGGVYNAGILVSNATSFTANGAHGSSGSPVFGGAIANLGTMTVSHSTLSDNSVVNVYWFAFSAGLACPTLPGTEGPLG
jgi:hypothetical protein